MRRGYKILWTPQKFDVVVQRTCGAHFQCTLILEKLVHAFLYHQGACFYFGRCDRSSGLASPGSSEPWAVVCAVAVSCSWIAEPLSWAPTARRLGSTLAARAGGSSLNRGAQFTNESSNFKFNGVWMLGLVSSSCYLLWLLLLLLLLSVKTTYNKHKLHKL